MWKRCWIVLGMVLSLLARPAPTAPLTSRNTNEDPAAKERLLRSFGKDAKDALEAKFKFLVYTEDGESLVAFAGNKLTFEKERWTRLSPCHAAVIMLEDGKEKPRYHMTSPEIELEFDRPVRSLEEIRKSRLRTIKSANQTIICGPEKRK
jgi:hypothetical protein